LHVPSAQHGLPGAPQVRHTDVDEQTSPAPRQLAGVVPWTGQQASLAFCPQVAQLPFRHRVPGAVHSEGVAPEFALQHG